MGSRGAISPAHAQPLLTVRVHLAPWTKASADRCRAFYEDLERRGPADPSWSSPAGPAGSAGRRGGLPHEPDAQPGGEAARGRAGRGPARAARGLPGPLDRRGPCAPGETRRQTRTAERWRGVPITELAREPLREPRDPRIEAHRQRHAPAVTLTPEPEATRSRLCSTNRTRLRGREEGSRPPRSCPPAEPVVHDGRPAPQAGTCAARSTGDAPAGRGALRLSPYDTGRGGTARARRHPRIARLAAATGPRRGQPPLGRAPRDRAGRAPLPVGRPSPVSNRAASLCDPLG